MSKSGRGISRQDDCHRALEVILYPDLVEQGRACNKQGTGERSKGKEEFKSGARPGKKMTGGEDGKVY